MKTVVKSLLWLWRVFQRQNNQVDATRVNALLWPGHLFNRELQTGVVEFEGCGCLSER